MHILLALHAKNDPSRNPGCPKLAAFFSDWLTSVLLPLRAGYILTGLSDVSPRTWLAAQNRPPEGRCPRHRRSTISCRCFSSAPGDRHLTRSPLGCRHSRLGMGQLGFPHSGDSSGVSYLQGRGRLGMSHIFGLPPGRGSNATSRRRPSAGAPMLGPVMSQSATKISRRQSDGPLLGR